LNIRLATAADIPNMVDLGSRCETAAHWTEGQYRSALPACGAGLTSRLVLAAEEIVDEERLALTEAASRRKGSLAGFLVARHQGPEWELENIVVDPGSRREGVGTRLLKELFGRAQAAGSESIYLEVRESNRSARAFYERWGFRESGRRKGYYLSPQEDAIVYHWTHSEPK